MGQVIDFAAARAARSATDRIMQVRGERAKRPTLAQAIEQYDRHVFASAALVNNSAVAHRVDARRDFAWEGGTRQKGYAHCGAGAGVLSVPDGSVLVCLRCWPWWSA